VPFLSISNRPLRPSLSFKGGHQQDGVPPHLSRHVTKFKMKHFLEDELAREVPFCGHLEDLTLLDILDAGEGM
jgi:hypothetical protein